MGLRIVQAMGSRHKGGAQRFFLRLVEGMHRRGSHRAAIVKRGGWCEDQLRNASATSHSLPFGAALDFMTVPMYRSILRNCQADVVMTYLERATKATPRGPWVHVGRLGGYYDLKDYANCDHLVANTPGIADYIKENGWDGSRVSMIGNFVPPPIDTAPVSRMSHTTPDDAPLLVWLGRMEHTKGPHIAVRVLARMPGAYLWLIGSGAYEAEVRKLASALGVADRARFLGWQDDIHPFLAAADFFLCTSRAEALGNIILEAWCHRLPIIAGRSPGPEHLIEDRRTGLLVANDSPDAMAAALNELIANPDLANNIAAAGHEHFKKTYSEDAIVTMYVELFQRLVAEKALRAPNRMTTT